MSKMWMRELKSVLVIICFTASVQGAPSNEECSGDEIPDLNGAWVCNDEWIVDAEEGTSEIDDAKNWIVYLELPKFYAVSKIQVTPVCEPMDSPILQLQTSVWDERFDRKDDEKLTDVAESHWNYVEIKNFSFVGNSQEYVGFARRSPYWRLTIDTFGIDAVHCLPKFKFFAKAGIAASQHYMMDLEIPLNTSSVFKKLIYSDAPVESTCGRVVSVPSSIVSKYKLDTSFYRKYTSAYGIPILSSNAVDDKALQRACYVVRFMMADRQDLRNHMYQNKGRVAIIGRRETVPMVPEMRQYYWWTRRAAGGTYHNPVNVGAEENMLCERGDGYARNQDIFMHEFAHGVHLIACHTAIPNFNNRLQQSFLSARQRGLWSNTYANTDNREYFAEGVQAFFEQQREGPVGGDGIQNHINTREELRRHDSTLYKIIDELFPCYNDYIPRCNDIGQGQGLSQNLKMSCRTGTGGTTISPGTTRNPGSCTDDNTSCSHWSGIGECKKNPKYMLVNCKKSCNVCVPPEPITTRSSTTSMPSTFTSSVTTTSTSSTTVIPTNTGNGSTTISPGTTRNPSSCTDDNTSCSRWSGIGECKKNPEYMLVNCKKSCNFCKPPEPVTTRSSTTSLPSTLTSSVTTTTASSTTVIPTNTTTTAMPTTTTVKPTTAPTTTTAIPITTTPPITCNDNHKWCSYWAKNGECSKSPSYMIKNCKKSCKTCTGVSCVDTDSNCIHWGGYCDSNLHVKRKCLKTCNRC